MQKRRWLWSDHFRFWGRVLLFPLLLGGIVGCRNTFGGGDYCNVAPPITDPHLLLGESHQIYLSAPDSGSFYAINTRNGSLLWKYHVAVGRELTANGIVYLETADQDHISALRARDGKLLWQRDGQADEFLTLLAVADGQLYFSIGTRSSAMHRVEAVRASDGSLLWWSPEMASDVDISHASQTGSPLTVVNGMVYLVTSDAEITVLRERDGTLVWRYTPSPAVGSSGPLRLESTAIGESIIFLSIEDDQTYAFQVSDGKLLWHSPKRGALLLGDGVVYISVDRQRISGKPPDDTGYDGQIYALGASDGKQFWVNQIEKEANGPTPVRLFNGMLYVVSRSIYQGDDPFHVFLAALRASDGKVLWVSPFNTESGVSPTVMVSSTIVYLLSGNMLDALREEDGSSLWHHSLSYGGWLITDDAVYIGTAGVTQTECYTPSNSTVEKLRINDGFQLWYFKMGDVSDPSLN